MNTGLKENTEIRKALSMAQKIAKSVNSSSEVDAQKENIIKDIASIINKYSRENESNTPDFILAKYLEQCLKAFETACIEREEWYHKKLTIDEVDNS